MILKELSEDLNPNYDIMNTSTMINLEDDVFNKIHSELHAVIIDYATPEIKFIGVNELYTINYILNNYNLTFKCLLQSRLWTLLLQNLEAS